MKIHIFRSEAATASHLDSKIQSDPWVTPLPHSTKNKKNKLLVFSPLPSSLAAGQFSDPTSHLSLRTSHQAIHYASNPLDPVPHHPFALPSAHLSDRTSHFSLRYSNHCVLRPCHLDRACLPLLAFLFALPSSLLGADPFLCHPALLGLNHCLQTPLSVSCCCSKSLI